MKIVSIFVMILFSLSFFQVIMPSQSPEFKAVRKESFDVATQIASAREKQKSPEAKPYVDVKSKGLQSPTSKGLQRMPKFSGLTAQQALEIAHTSDYFDPAGFSTGKKKYARYADSSSGQYHAEEGDEDDASFNGFYPGE